MVGSFSRSRSTLAANSSRSLVMSFSSCLRRARSRRARPPEPNRSARRGHSAPMRTRTAQASRAIDSQLTLPSYRPSLTYDELVDEALEAACRWLAQDERVALATVVATRRSAPRPVGSKLAVSESGELAGSVSGGCVESDVYENAREVFATGR